MRLTTSLASSKIAQMAQSAEGLQALDTYGSSDHDIDYDIDHDIIANPPAMSDGKSHIFGYGIMKDFNVIIPSCTGELG